MQRGCGNTGKQPPSTVAPVLCFYWPACPFLVLGTEQLQVQEPTSVPIRRKDRTFHDFMCYRADKLSR